MGPKVTVNLAIIGVGVNVLSHKSSFYSAIVTVIYIDESMMDWNYLFEATWIEVV